MEGVLWAVRAQLVGVMGNVRDLMYKVDMGLGLVMGLGVGCWVAWACGEAKGNIGCVDGLDVRGMKSGGWGPISGGQVN